MTFFDKIYAFISSISPREFQWYSLAVFGSIFLFIAFTDIQFYRKSRALLKKIKTLNDDREERVKTILTQGAFIKQQQEEMNRILSEDLDFKIAGYCNALLKKMGLLNKKITETATQADIDQTHRESTLQIRLEELNMKDLAELLQEFENNKRICIKHLDIAKSSKNPNTIDVLLTITTMLLKTFSES